MGRGSDVEKAEQIHEKVEREVWGARGIAGRGPLHSIKGGLTLLMKMAEDTEITRKERG